MDIKNYVVYMITCSNEKFRYIGVTKQKLKNRFYQHKKANSKIGNYIRKYKDTKIEILESELTKEEAYLREYELVPKTQKLREEQNFLNLVQGGKIIERPVSANNRLEINKKISDIIKKKFLNDEDYRNKILNNCKLRYKKIENRKKYKVTGPDGKLWTEEDCTISSLCKLYNISTSNMCQLIKGKIHYLKGFKRPDNLDYIPVLELQFILKSPEGELIYGKNLQKFCTEQNLRYDYIRRMIKGSKGEGSPIYKRYKSHRGWTVPGNDELLKN